jgi:RNA polymerase sigma-70 factor (TIGR02943 family)
MGLSTTKSGSAADPSSWLAEHGDALWRYAIGRTRDAELAEEVVQETLVAALDAYPSFRGESSERTWLLAILRRKLVDQFRARGRERAGAGGVLGEMFDKRGRWRFDPGRPPADGMLESPEFLADFERCLSKLPAGLAEAFVLREVRGSPAEAACAALRISMDNLWVRMHRARLLLRKCLAERWSPARKGGC